MASGVRYKRYAEEERGSLKLNAFFPVDVVLVAVNPKGDIRWNPITDGSIERSIMSTKSRTFRLGYS